jgi:hypothetical protein
MSFAWFLLQNFWKLKLMSAPSCCSLAMVGSQACVRMLRSSLAKEKIYHNRLRLAAISELNHVPEKFANSSINALCLFGRIDERTAAVLMASS